MGRRFGLVILKVGVGVEVRRSGRRFGLVLLKVGVAFDNLGCGVGVLGAGRRFGVVLLRVGVAFSVRIQSSRLAMLGLGRRPSGV